MVEHEIIGYSELRTTTGTLGKIVPANLYNSVSLVNDWVITNMYFDPISCVSTYLSSNLNTGAAVV